MNVFRIAWTKSLQYLVKFSVRIFTVRLHVMQRTVLLSQFCLSICLSVRHFDVLACNRYFNVCCRPRTFIANIISTFPECRCEHKRIYCTRLSHRPIVVIILQPKSEQANVIATSYRAVPIAYSDGLCMRSSLQSLHRPTVLQIAAKCSKSHDYSWCWWHNKARGL